MLNLFDGLVLALVVIIVSVWFWRHLRKVFSARCDSSACASCTGCSKGHQSE